MDLDANHPASYPAPAPPGGGVEHFDSSLEALLLELHVLPRLPETARKLARGAVELMGARSAAVAVTQGETLEPIAFHGAWGELAEVPQLPSVNAAPAAEGRNRSRRVSSKSLIRAEAARASERSDAGLLRRLQPSLAALAAEPFDAMLAIPADEAIGRELASSLGWQWLAIVRLQTPKGEQVGLLCLVDCAEELSTPQHVRLAALAKHAAVALDNARRHGWMDRANRHWTQIFDSISDLILVHNEGGKVTRVNRSMADFIGIRPAQLIGVNMRALLAMGTDVKGPDACPLCRSEAEADGAYLHTVLDRTYLVSSSTIHGAANEGTETIHVLKDITDRREAEQRYRELFTNIQEGLFFSTPEGRFIEVNEALVRMLGYETREELLAADIASQLYLTPRHHQRFETAMQQSGGVLRNHQEVLRRKDSSLVYVLMNAFAVRDSQGSVTQYRGLMLDITELKNFQAELQRERDFSSKILNHTQSLIVVADTAGLVSYANRRCYEAGKCTEAQLLGHKLTDLVPSQRRQRMAHAVELCLLGEQVDNLELPIVLGNGHTGRFSLNLSPMRDEQGAVNSIVVVMTDITDAAMLQAKLVHTEKMAAVGQLVSGVAHEVNNPLTAVLGFTDLLLENPDVPESAKKDLAVVLQEAQRTKQIVQNLLSFARQMPPQRQPLQINAVLQRTLALRSYDFANNDIRVVERFDPNLPEVIGDAHQLQQVFLNIVNNAYDAVCDTEAPGQIEVETAVISNFVEVRFRDNGPGITDPDRIFDPFFTTKDVGKGTGLGLSICYGIVHQHGGEIIGHNNVGIPGATFTVRLPLKSSEEAAGGEQSCATSAAVGGHE